MLVSVSSFILRIATFPHEIRASLGLTSVSVRSSVTFALDYSGVYMKYFWYASLTSHAEPITAEPALGRGYAFPLSLYLSISPSIYLLSILNSVEKLPSDSAFICLPTSNDLTCLLDSVFNFELPANHGKSYVINVKCSAIAVLAYKNIRYHSLVSSLRQELRLNYWSSLTYLTCDSHSRLTSSLQVHSEVVLSCILMRTLTCISSCLLSILIVKYVSKSALLTSLLSWSERLLVQWMLMMFSRASKFP